MSGSKTLALSSAKRSTSARYAAKLIASFLLANVRSLLGWRSFSPNCVPTALLSYATHASKMQVCTIARARATIGGPMRESRTPCNAATFHCTTTVSLAAALPAVVIWNIRIPIASRNQKRATLADEGKFSDIEGSFNFMHWRHILGHRAKSRLHSCRENYEIAASGTSAPAHLDNSAARHPVSSRGSSLGPSSIPT